MTTPNAAPLVRVLVVLLALAVLGCLAVPMSGDGEMVMHVVMACCFVLAIAFSVFVLRPPQAAALLEPGLGRTTPLARGPTRTARAPDVFALGSLLI